MKLNKSLLLRAQNEEITWEETLSFTLEEISKIDNLSDLQELKLVGRLFFDSHDEHIVLQVMIEGIMLVPCSRSLVEVTYPFRLEEELRFSIDRRQDDEAIFLSPDLSFSALILELIALEVPYQIISPDATYLSGDGWEVLSEQNYYQKK